MTKIVYEKTDKREGNDCILTDYYYILEVSSDMYVAGHVQYYNGCWGRDTQNTSQTVTSTLDEALEFLGENDEQVKMFIDWSRREEQ